MSSTFDRETLAERFDEAEKIGFVDSTAVEFQPIEFTLLMVQKSRTTTWDVSNPVNNGINYQPQLVQDFFHQQ